MVTCAKLIAVTQPTKADLTAEGLIAYCARVSNPANQDSPDSERLLRYLIRNAHWSPFEMAHAVVEIETTRDIARQVLRHRSFSFQEFSQRYAEVTPDPAIREARMQDASNRQNSTETDDAELKSAWRAAQVRVWEVAADAYRNALDAGIAKEVARAVLPEGMTLSRLYMAGSLRSWLHYLDVRLGNGTQREHIEVASAVMGALRPAFPAIMGMVMK